MVWNSWNEVKTVALAKDTYAREIALWNRVKVARFTMVSYFGDHVRQFKIANFSHHNTWATCRTEQ